MDTAVLSTYPYSCRKLRRISDEPAVRLVVCSTRLSGNLTFEIILGTQSYTGSSIYDALHQIDHQICCLFADRLSLRIIEFTQKIAVPVLYPGHKQRCDIHAL